MSGTTVRNLFETVLDGNGKHKRRAKDSNRQAGGIMQKKPEYYEFYGELVASNIFLKRIIILLIVANVVLIYLAYLGFTRPPQTFAINDGYAYSTTPYGNLRTVHEVRQFAYEFATNLLAFNRENFNQRVKKALRMCTVELEHLIYNTITTSEIPKIVQSTAGNIEFKIDELMVREGDPYRARVVGKQIFPGQSPILLKFTLEINVVDRSAENPFGLKVVNYMQEKS